MSKKFLITLKPIDKFFFGGDMTFAVSSPEDVNNKKQQNERYSSYIIKSRHLPQQTSLLGMLRFLILSNSPFFKDGKIVNKKEASKLIGPQSFMVLQEGAGTFGQIEEVGACFLINKFDKDNIVFYSFAPFDSEYICRESDKFGVLNGLEIQLPNLTGYNAKDGYTVRIKGSDDKYVTFSDIFVEDRRLGIDRNIISGKTDDSSLFKQISYRFNDFSKDGDTGAKKKIADWHFAFYVTVKDECNISEYDGSIVSVGGDNSKFVLRVNENIGDIRPQLFGRNAEKVVLQSPTYIERKDLSGVTFFITQIIPFRFMQTTVNNTVDYTLRAGYQRSCRYELYAPGSVFYFRNNLAANDFKKVLDSYKAFRNIGYNEYK